MELRRVDEDLWRVEDTLRLPGVHFPVRSAVVRLGDGSVVVFSPLPQLMKLEQELRALGIVRAFVSPNTLHHLGLGPAHAAFPEAELLGVPGLLAKRTDIPFSRALSGQAEPLWAEEVDQLAVGGMPKVDERVFFHRKSRTLILGDLCFNIRRSEHGPTRIFMRLNGAYGHFGPSRIARWMMKDPAAVRASVDRMLAWNPERILVCHGEMVERDGRRALEDAFAFLRPGA